MTAPRRDGRHATGFAQWARGEPRLDSLEHGLAMLDVDWIWHQYRVTADRIGQRRVNHIMLIEEKAFGAEIGFSQRDTMWILHQALLIGDGRKFRNARQELVTVRLWGYHGLRYSADRPDTSSQIWWDKKEISLDTLVWILRFELHPVTLQPMSDRRHHPPKTSGLLFNE